MTEKESYPLGDNTEEQQRLMLQARVITELTRDVFARAGLATGMRVLDVGCGVGDVSLLARSFVGETGSVLGIDRSAESLTVARRRARSCGYSNVEFVEASLERLELQGSFDGLVGRFILLYLPEPALALERLVRLVRPGGLVVFQEMDFGSGGALPAAPLYKRVGQWITATFERAGAHTQMGSLLYSTFLRAGLPTPQLWAGSRIAGGECGELFQWLASTVRSLLPLMEKLGVATREEVGIDSLASRLQAEVASGGGVLHTPRCVGAWTKKPA
jgi:ubiquinone/menaquinone biosynthesis C-methylase UbiE